MQNIKWTYWKNQYSTIKPFTQTDHAFPNFIFHTQNKIPIDVLPKQNVQLIFLYIFKFYLFHRSWPWENHWHPIGFVCINLIYQGPHSIFCIPMITVSKTQYLVAISYRKLFSHFELSIHNTFSWLGKCKLIPQCNHSISKNTYAISHNDINVSIFSIILVSFNSQAPTWPETQTSYLI